MYQIDGIVELIEGAGLASVGEDLFIYHSPADVHNCIILYPSNDPPIIDPDTPGYFKGKFQTIVRSDDYTSGLALCQALSDALTLFNTDTEPMFIKTIRPMYQARAYRRSDSGAIEFSITYDIRYTANN
jgi:hypothetical protein